MERKRQPQRTPQPKRPKYVDDRIFAILATSKVLREAQLLAKVVVPWIKESKTW